MAQRSTTSAPSLENIKQTGRQTDGQRTAKENNEIGEEEEELEAVVVRVGVGQRVDMEHKSHHDDTHRQQRLRRRLAAKDHDEDDQELARDHHQLPPE